MPKRAARINYSELAAENAYDSDPPASSRKKAKKQKATAPAAATAVPEAAASANDFMAEQLLQLATPLPHKERARLIGAVWSKDATEDVRAKEFWKGVNTHHDDLEGSKVSGSIYNQRGTVAVRFSGRVGHDGMFMYSRSAAASLAARKVPLAERWPPQASFRGAILHYLMHVLNLSAEQADVTARSMAPAKLMEQTRLVKGFAYEIKLTPAKTVGSFVKGRDVSIRKF